ncbi:unnamed protein product, partial [Trichobilharzia regenti]
MVTLLFLTNIFYNSSWAALHPTNLILDILSSCAHLLYFPFKSGDEDYKIALTRLYLENQMLAHFMHTLCYICNLTKSYIPLKQTTAHTTIIDNNNNNKHRNNDCDTLTLKSIENDPVLLSHTQSILMVAFKLCCDPINLHGTDSTDEIMYQYSVYDIINEEGLTCRKILGKQLINLLFGSDLDDYEPEVKAVGRIVVFVCMFLSFYVFIYSLTLLAMA